MGKENRGKEFEAQIQSAFEAIPNTSVDRLHDQMSGYMGSSNICDFIVYHMPFQYYIECKSCHGNTLSIHSNGERHHYGDITDTQWNGLLEKSKISGVIAGYMIWFIDHDVTVFVLAKDMKEHRDLGNKSFHIAETDNHKYYKVPGRKKRILFEYDLTDFVGGAS